MIEDRSQISRHCGNTPVNIPPGDYTPGGEAQARWFILPSGPDAGKKMYFYDYLLGEGEPQSTLCFVHGNPESSYTYRGIVAELERHSDACLRIIAMDHIGFGLSDQASFEMVDMHHSHNLSLLIKHLNLNPVCLLVHDWGGAIGIGAFINQPDKVSHLVIMNTTIFPIPRDDRRVYDQFPLPGPLSWNRVAHWLPNSLWRYIAALVVCGPAHTTWQFISGGLGFFTRAVSGKLSDKEQLHVDMFNTPMNSLSSRRNACQTHLWGHGYRYFDTQLGWQDNHAFYQQMQSSIQQNWGNKIPAIGFFGDYDVLAKASVIQQWLQHLPQLEGHIKHYPKRGHFIEEWEPQDIAAGIRQLIKT